jgi:hypothetical protein
MVQPMPPRRRARDTILPAVPASTGLSWFFLLIGPFACLGAPACGTPGSGGDSADEGEDQSEGDEPADSRVELGTGTTTFEVLEQESPLILVAGPQGGHHFVVHARMWGMDPGDPTMPGQIENPATRFTVSDEEGEPIELEVAPYRLGYERDGDDFVLPSGRIVQVRESAVPNLYGARAYIRVEVTDAEGETASDGRWVMAIEQPRDAARPAVPATRD